MASRKTRFRLLVLSLVVIVMSVSGGVSFAGTASAKPKQGGSLTILNTSELPSFDPVTQIVVVITQTTILNPVFDALVAENRAGGLDYRLLQSAQSADGLTWMLKVRPGVKFSDRTALDAEAIVFNWKRMADPANRPSSLALLAAQSIASMEAVDATTVKVVLKTASALFPRQIAQTPLRYIGSPTALQSNPKGFLTNPIAAGAYTVKEWVRGDHLTLVRNPNYYGTAYLDEITLRYVPDETLRVNTYKTGAAQIMTTSNPNTVNGDTTSKYVVDEAPVGGFALIFNLTKPPFDNLKVRQAFGYAMDGKAMSDALFQGATTPVNNMFEKGSPFYSKKYDQPPANKKKAQALFDEIAAANGGQPLKVVITTYLASSQQAQWFQATMASYKNVEVTLDQITDPTAFIPKIASKAYSAAFNQSFGNDPDALYNFLSTKGTQNFTGFNDPAVDAALDTQRTASDLKTRVAAFNTVQKKVLEIVPWVYYQRLAVGALYDPKVVSGFTSKTWGAANMWWNQVWLTTK